MVDDRQKEIFSKNLIYYLELNGKTQKEFAKDIGETPTTVNNWIKKVSFPSLGKIQKMADYFYIGKSDLTDDKIKLTEEVADIQVKVLQDIELQSALKKYFSLPANRKQKVLDFINLMYED